MSPVGSISFSPDGEYIASSSKDRTIRLWNSKTGEVTLKLIGNYNEPISISFSPDAKYAASASGSNSKGLIQLWNVKTDEAAPSKPFGRSEDSMVNCVAFSPNWTYIVAGSGM